MGQNRKIPRSDGPTRLASVRVARLIRIDAVSSERRRGCGGGRGDQQVERGRRGLPVGERNAERVPGKKRGRPRGGPDLGSLAEGSRIARAEGQRGAGLDERFGIAPRCPEGPVTRVEGGTSGSPRWSCGPG